jgi:hypothetical protein
MPAMDETPEEMEEIRREAAAIDTNKYRRRYRLIVGSLVSLLFLGVGYTAISMARAARNPCERVRAYFCKQAPDPVKCAAYDGIFKESEQDDSARMRSMIRDQCLTKIERLKTEEGITLE